ncbi:right-handed parallel beta-helix repeat-containing protein [Candidatus Omnitrophota bacterium]
MLRSQKGATFIELLIVVLIAITAFGLALVGLLRMAVLSTGQTVEFSSMQNEASLIMRTLTKDIQRSNSIYLNPGNSAPNYMKLSRSPAIEVEYETNGNNNLVYTDENGNTSVIAENITNFNVSGQTSLYPPNDWKCVRISLTKTSPKTKASPRDFTLTTAAYCRVPTIAGTGVAWNVTQDKFYNSIGGAIADAAAGDEIRCLGKVSGIFNGIYNENIGIQSLTLKGGYDLSFEEASRDIQRFETVIDASNTGYSNVSAMGITSMGVSGDTTIDGFTITKGTGSGSWYNSSFGGGIYIADYGAGNPSATYTITNNKIIDNTCNIGCAIRGAIKTNLVLRNNTISDNKIVNPSDWAHPGPRCAVELYVNDSVDVDISNNDFTNNEGDVINIKNATGSPTISITSNNIVGNSYPAIVFSQELVTTEQVIIQNNNIAGNLGGGIIVHQSSAATVLIDSNNITGNNGYPVISCRVWATITNNFIKNNHKTSGPGYFGTSGGINVGSGYMVVKNNIIVGNYAEAGGPSAIYYLGANAQISNNTILNNENQYGSYSIDGMTSPAFNNIIQDSWSGYNGPASSPVFYSCFPTATNGVNNNISNDPLFIDPANGDYHLDTGSLCINAGDPSILDPDGSVSDIGAYGGPGAGIIGASQPYGRQQ